MLIGTIDRIVLGRLSGESVDDPFAARTIGIAVHVDTVEDGRSAAPPGQTMWIEVPLGSSTVEEAAANLPPGTPVAAFVEPAWPSTPDDPMLEETAAYPDGVRLWSPVGPQALAFGYSDVGVVAPMADQVDRTETVEDVVESPE